MMEVINPLDDYHRRNWVRTNDGVIAGVCKGLSRQLEIDVAILRIILIVAFLFFGTGLLLYLACWIALPSESRLREARQSRIMGVCRRISDRYGIDIGLVRLGTLLLTGLSFGLTIFAYLVLHFVLDNSKQEDYL